MEADGEERWKKKKKKRRRRRRRQKVIVFGRDYYNSEGWLE